MPMDNSTDPPISDLTISSVEDAFGKVAEMSKSDASDVLYELCAPHWIMGDGSRQILEMLILRADLQHDLDALVDLGLEDYYRN
jgi:hypothetical protein